MHPSVRSKKFPDGPFAGSRNKLRSALTLLRGSSACSRSSLHDGDAGAATNVPSCELGWGATHPGAEMGAPILGGRMAFEKFWRRPQLTLAQGYQCQERATLGPPCRRRTQFLGRRKPLHASDKSPPGVQLFGAIPGNFATRNWTLARGRQSASRRGWRAQRLRARRWIVRTPGFRRLALAIVKLDGINYMVVA